MGLGVLEHLFGSLGMGVWRAGVVRVYGYLNYDSHWPWEED